MAGRSSQRKGRGGELELCRILQNHGIGARPGRPQSYGEESDIVGVPGLHLEVKRCERWSLPAWIAQAERDAAAMGDGAPAVIFRSNRQPWRVCLQLSDFLDIYSSWIATK